MTTPGNATGAAHRTLTAAESPMLKIAERRRRDVTVVEVTGEVDLLTAPQLGQALEQAVSAHPRLFVVDLSKVEFLGCAGLTVLLTSHRQTGTRTCLRVVANGPATLRPLRVTALDQTLAVYETLSAALADPVKGLDTDTPVKGSTAG